MIKKTEVKVLLVTYVCDKCKQGIMQAVKETLVTGTRSITVRSNKKSFPHICSNCGQRTRLPKVFPFMEYNIPGDKPISGGPVIQ